MPSKIINGSLPALIELIPRTRIVGVVAPGWPEDVFNCTPETLPVKALATLEV